MTDLEILKKIEKSGSKTASTITDAFEVCRAISLTDKEFAQKRIMLYDNAVNKRLADENTPPKEKIALRELSKKMCLFLAPDYLDYYIRYMEFDREPQKRFYLPRRKQLLPLVNDLQDLADRKIDFLGICLPPRVGKLVSDDTPVLTRNGWKNHGDLVIGDEVISPRGDFVRVTRVFPKNAASVRVHFTDGTYVDVHENHEWVVNNRHCHKVQVLETKAMMHDYETGTPGKRGHRYHYQIPFKNFVEGEYKKLPVEPYTLGAWLGDGRNRNPDVCGSKADYPIIEGIVADGYPVSWHTTHKTTGVEYFGFRELRKGLQELGMCHSRRSVEKHIPQEYLTASIYQRMQLLAGLLDTDGCLRAKENRYDFTTAEANLKEDFISLISTFGWRCSVKEVEPCTSSSGIVGKRVHWVISFNPTCSIPCRLERKQLKEFSVPRRIAICGFEKIEPKPGNCISVDGGVYCVGKRLIPTHNSTLCIFFISWLMGKCPDDASVMSGHSDKLTDGFFREVISLITDNVTYKWADVFPSVPFVASSAKNETIDLNAAKRFPTFTARSISGTLTGAVEIGSNGVLYSDDLVEDLEESLSAERLQAKYDAYLNQLKDRKKEGAMELMVGTRWNILDPLGRVQDQYADNPRYRFTVIPALDENGESNFDYQYGLGFTTAYYMDMKASIDDATWCAKYMGQPYVREGLLFPREELRRYYELPKEEPDGIVSICDTKTTGTDYQFMPVAYQYGNDLYIEDCVCNNGSIEALDGLCAEILLKHGVKLCRFESNVAGGRTADQVQELVKSKGGVTHITKKYTTQNKETKIIMSSPSIKARCLFKDDSAIERGSEYAKMMNMLCTYTVAGKNKNDDVPDGLSQLVLFVESLQSGKVEVFYRPF